MGRNFGRMIVPMQGTDAVYVDDWSYMEYTFKPAAIQKNQQITDNNTFKQVAMQIAHC